MKSDELRQWIEQQEAAHGMVFEVFCMTALGNLAEGERLSFSQLVVTTPSKLPVDGGGVDDNENVIAIGFGNNL